MVDRSVRDYANRGRQPHVIIRNSVFNVRLKEGEC
jgi:hypothetical protein